MNTLPAGDAVTALAGGQFHSLAITNSGKVFAWGRVDGFATGLALSSLPEEHTLRDARGKAKILTQPTHVVVPGNVVSAAAGTDYSVVVNDQGKAFAWGFGDGCRTGLGTDEDVEVPREVRGKQLEGKKLTGVWAGGQFCVLAAEVKKDGEKRGEGEASG